MKTLDYKEQLSIGDKVMAVKDRNCPKCGERLVIIPPDRVWCESNSCRYSELHIVGDGVAVLKSEQIGILAI